MKNDKTEINYRSYDGKKGKYLICITLEVFGFLCREVYEIELGDQHNYVDERGYHYMTNPFSLAWKQLEAVLIDDCEVTTWECGCCVTPASVGGDVKFVSETIETLD
jgi:hypothetical protein